MQQLRSMKAWCQANPTKRKTTKGIKRFITSWLTREQDRGGGKRNDSSPTDAGGKAAYYGSFAGEVL
jgi:hypothetical protein